MAESSNSNRQTDPSSSEIAILRTIVEGIAHGTGQEFFSLFVQNLAKAIDVHYAFVAEFAGSNTRVRAMVRHRATPTAAIADVSGDGLRLRFERPQRAVAPGQLVALLDCDGDEVLGAATIN